MDRDTTQMILTFQGLETNENEKSLSTPIDILAWSFGAHVTAEENKPVLSHLQNISMTKYVTDATPLFFKCITEQRNFKTVVFESTNKNQNIKFLLQDVVITSISTGGSGGESRLTENICLGFKSMELVYEDRTKENTKAVKSGAIENKNPFGSGRNY